MARLKSFSKKGDLDISIQGRSPTRNIEAQKTISHEIFSPHQIEEIFGPNTNTKYPYKTFYKPKISKWEFDDIFINSPVRKQHYQPNRRYY